MRERERVWERERESLGEKEERERESGGERESLGERERESGRDGCECRELVYVSLLNVL